MCLLAGQEPAPLLSHLSGGDYYQVIHLVEILSRNQNWLTAVPSKSSFLPFPLHFFPRLLLLPFCQGPFLVESKTKQKARFPLYIHAVFNVAFPKGAHRLVQVFRVEAHGQYKSQEFSNLAISSLIAVRLWVSAAQLYYFFIVSHHVIL